MISNDRFAWVEITDLSQLRAWLVAHHGQESSVWLVRYKATCPEWFVDRLDVLDELICFGWIDGLARKLEGDRTMQLISPRRQQVWTQSYKDRAARLIVERRMAPPGLAAIARSKALGLWDASAAIDALDMPADLVAALASDPTAEAYFIQAAPSYRRNVLRWIHGAKKHETRRGRIEKLVLSSGRREKLLQM